MMHRQLCAFARSGVLSRQCLLHTLPHSRVLACTRPGSLQVLSKRSLSYIEPTSPLYNAAAAESWRSAVMGRLEDMHQTINLYRTMLLQGVIVVVAVSGWVVLLFGDDIKLWWGKQGADVGKMVLEDENVRNQAEALSKALAERVLTDPNMEKLAVQFVFQVVDQLLENPNTVDRAVTFLQEVSAREEAKESISVLVLHALSHPATQQFVNNYFASLVVSPPIVDASTRLAVQATHNALDNQAVQDHASQMVSDLMNSKKVQRDAGELLWAAIKYAVTPWRAQQASAPSSPNDPNPSSSQDRDSTHGAV